MFRSVFRKTLWDQRHGLIGWSIGTTLTVIVMAAIWPSYSSMDLKSILAQYPEAMKRIFNVADMTTGTGYMNAELFSLLLPALFVIYPAVAHGSRLIAGEEEEGTLDLLATMPVSRRLVLVEKGRGTGVEPRRVGLRPLRLDLGVVARVRAGHLPRGGVERNDGHVPHRSGVRARRPLAQCRNRSSRPGHRSDRRDRRHRPISST